MRIILSEDGADVWQHAHKRGVITAEQIRTCGIVPGFGWPDAVQGGGLAVGQLALLLFQDPDSVDPQAAMRLCNRVGIWWMLADYRDVIAQHALDLIEEQCAASDAIITVLLNKAEGGLQDRDPLGMPLDIDWISSNHVAFVSDDSHPTPAWVRDDVLQRDCPEGHTRVLFVVPSLSVSVSLVAEMEGLG